MSTNQNKKQTPIVSKFKNTAMIFEFITRKITEETFFTPKKDKKLPSLQNSKAYKIIETHFHKGSELLKELNLYNSLLKPTYLEQLNLTNENEVDKFISLILDERGKLNNSTLRRERHNLVESLKKEYKLEELFKIKIPNYKELGSIGFLFSNVHKINESINPIQLWNSQKTIQQYISNTTFNKKESNPIVENNIMLDKFSKMKQHERNLVIKLMFEKFKNTYSFNPQQMKLLAEYVKINNEVGGGKFVEFINKEVKNMDILLETLIPKTSKTDNDIIFEVKVKTCQNHLNKFFNKGKLKEIRNKHVIGLLKYYELIEELENFNNIRTKLHNNKNNKGLHNTIIVR